MGLADLAEEGVNLGEGVDFVTKQFDAVGPVVVGGPDFDDVAADAECATLEVGVVAFIEDFNEFLGNLFAADTLTFFEHEEHAVVGFRGAEAVDATDAGNDDAIAAFKEGAGGGEAEFIEFVVDGGFFFDVGVGVGDVGFGLVVVVIADEVLDGVVGEKLLEFLVELGGEDFVVGEDEGGAAGELDDLGHGEGLSGAGDAEQDLVGIAVVDAADEGFDGGALVATGLIGGAELVGHVLQYRESAAGGPFIEACVEFAAEHGGEAQEVHPDDEGHNGADGAIEDVVIGDIADIPGEAGSEGEPEDGGEDGAGPDVAAAGGLGAEAVHDGGDGDDGGEGDGDADGVGEEVNAAGEDFAGVEEAELGEDPGFDAVAKEEEGGGEEDGDEGADDEDDGEEALAENTTGMGAAVGGLVGLEEAGGDAGGGPGGEQGGDDGDGGGTGAACEEVGDEGVDAGRGDLEEPGFDALGDGRGVGLDQEGGDGGEYGEEGKEGGVGGALGGAESAVGVGAV